MTLDPETVAAAVDEGRAIITVRNCFVAGENIYGVHCLTSRAELLKGFANQKPKVRFAEDECGNYFTVSKANGQVWFWDHETNKSELLAQSLDEFFSALTAEPPVELKPNQVMGVWVDPDFAKALHDRKSNT